MAESVFENVFRERLESAMVQQVRTTLESKRQEVLEEAIAKMKTAINKEIGTLAIGIAREMNVLFDRERIVLEIRVKD